MSEEERNETNDGNNSSLVSENRTRDHEVWSEDHGFYRHSFGISMLLVVAYSIVVVIGVVGNSLVVAVVSRSPRMRTVTNLFILNLAVADLLVVLFCLPPTLISNLFVPWILGEGVCKVVAYIQGVSVSASVYSLVAVSLDRFLAIWFPLGRGLTKGRARFIIFFIWIVSCGFALPWALFFTLASHNHVEYCVEEWPDHLDGDLYFLVGNFLFCYLFPLGGISLCYLLIWIRVTRRHVPTDSAAALQKVHQKAKMGVLRMLIVVVMVFLLSWLPLYVLFTRVKFGSKMSEGEEKVVAIATPIAQWLGSSNSCINPLLYAFLNVKFRKAFLALLPPCWRPKEPPQLITITKTSLIQRQQTTSLINATTGV